MKRWRVPGVGAVVALLFLAAYFTAVHQPRQDEIGQLEAETNQLRAQQVVLRRSIDALEEVAERQTQFETARDVLERLIPSGLSQPAVLKQLQAAADQAGVRLVSVTFGEPEEPEDGPVSEVPDTVLVAMPVTVAVEGPFLGITDLLRRVEVDIERAVLVDTVALTEAEAGFPQLTGTWSGRAYTLLPVDDPLLLDPDKVATTEAAPTTSKAPAPSTGSTQPASNGAQGTP